MSPLAHKPIWSKYAAAWQETSDISFLVVFNFLRCVFATPKSRGFGQREKRRQRGERSERQLIGKQIIISLWRADGGEG